MPESKSGRGPKVVEKTEPTDAPVLTPEEARQGVVSGRVRMILTVSLALALVAFAVLYAVYA